MSLISPINWEHNDQHPDKQLNQNLVRAGRVTANAGQGSLSVNGPQTLVNSGDQARVPDWSVTAILPSDWLMPSRAVVFPSDHVSSHLMMSIRAVIMTTGIMR